MENRSQNKNFKVVVSMNGKMVSTDWRAIKISPPKNILDKVKTRGEAEKKAEEQETTSLRLTIS